MNPKKMLTSLVPWAVYSVLVERVGAHAAGYAALLAAVLALVLVIKDRAHGVKLIDAAGVGTFAILSAIAFMGSEATRVDIAHYGRGISTLVLGLIMLGSVLVLPFTEQYARESVPRQYWGSPVFKSVNRRISAVWGGVVVAMACGHLLSGHLEATGNQTSGTNLILNWGIPVALALWAIKFTNRVTSDDTADAV